MTISAFPFWVLTLSLLFNCQLSNSQGSDYTQQRGVYQQASNTLKQRKLLTTENYLKIQQQLEGYPLSAYFQHDYLLQKFSTLPTVEIDTFLDVHADQYIAQRMRINWLTHLAKHKEWRLFEQYYQPTSYTSLQCSAILGQLALNKQDSSHNPNLWSKTSQIWLSSKSLPDNCDPLFEKWKDAGYLTHDLAWERFQLVYTANQMKLATYLKRHLNEQQKLLANRLLQSDQYASYWLTQLPKTQPSPHLKSATIKRLLRRLSSRHHEKVSLLIATKKLAMNEADLLEIKKLCAWYYAKNDAQHAQKWLNTLPSGKNQNLLEFEIRYALQAKDWKNYQHLFLQLTPSQQEKPEWLYWYAISQKNNLQLDPNIHRQPTAIFAHLSKQRHFYGFLSAEHDIKNTYFIGNEPLEHDLDQVIQKKLAAAFELFRLNETRQANREWFFVTRSFNKEQWQQAAFLADNIQWYERSIQAHAKAQLWNQVDARFPLAFAETFKKHSDKQSINPSWLFAMARQESGFSPFATSHVGAKGVLQLMPSTAKRVAHSMKVSYHPSRLYDPSYNISLGSKYLKDLLSKFDNNYILATAAYNAGPHRVNEWVGLRPMTDDWAHWVATIPYEETRKYVQNILTYSIIYNSLLNNTVAQLSDFAVYKETKTQ